MYADPTLMDLAAAYAKRRNGRKTKHAVACDRPGAKAKMAITKEQIRGASREELRAIEQRLMALAKSGDKNADALLDYVEQEYNERYRGTHSRPGAKAKFSLQKNSEFILGEYSVKVLSDLMNYMGDPKAKTAMVSYLASGQQATRGAIVVTHDGKQVSLYNPGGALIRSGAAKFSRPGAKAKSTHAGPISASVLLDYAMRAESRGDKAAAKNWTKQLVEAISAGEKLGGGQMRDADKLRSKYGFSKSTHAATTPVAVTEAEYAAIAARDAVSKKILGDSQYQITEQDRRVRAAGDAAYKAALARHNAWHAAWNAAATDEERAKIEAKAKAAEAGMRVYRASRPGAKAKMNRMDDATRRHLRAWIVKWFHDVDDMVEAEQKMEKIYEADPEFYADAGWPKVARDAGLRGFSRPGAKAKFGKPQFRVRKLYDGYLAVDVNQGGGWERYDTTHEDSWDGLDDYERGYEKAYARGLRWIGGAWRIPSSHSSRPGAKATHAALPPQTLEAERKPGGGSHSEAVSRKIATLINEGKPQDQAVAIALDLERRGEL